MPLMGWDSFCECHSRPFLIEAQLAAGAPEEWHESLPGFIRSMRLKGNFSLCRDNERVRAAVELEADAKQVVRALGAKKMGTGDEWAGQWRLIMDWAEGEKVAGRTAAFIRSPAPQMRLKLPSMATSWPARFCLLICM